MDDGLITISKVELAAIVRTAIREELHAVGLRADDANQVDEARKDFLFMRRMRTFTESLANKIVLTLVVALVGGLATIVGLGVQAWLQQKVGR
jgi:hypothetical protein